MSGVRSLYSEANHIEIKEPQSRGTDQVDFIRCGAHGDDAFYFLLRSADIVDSPKVGQARPLSDGRIVVGVGFESCLLFATRELRRRSNQTPPLPPSAPSRLHSMEKSSGHGCIPKGAPSTHSGISVSVTKIQSGPFQPNPPPPITGHPEVFPLLPEAHFPMGFISE